MLLVRLHIDYIDLLKLKATNYLKLVMLTYPGFFFKEANSYSSTVTGGVMHNRKYTTLPTPLDFS